MVLTAQGSPVAEHVLDAEALFREARRRERRRRAGFVGVTVAVLIAVAVPLALVSGRSGPSAPPKPVPTLPRGFAYVVREVRPRCPRGHP